MTQFFKFAIYSIAATCMFSSGATADVVLTFDQSGIFNSVAIDQEYGDNVIASPDGNGHGYNIIAGNGFGLTPNVEVSYTAGESDLWTTGYGNLTNVLYDEADFSPGFEIIFNADPGFEVGLFGFDMAVFGGVDSTLPGIEILDGGNDVLWSSGPTLIDSTMLTSFDTGGVFADSLTIAIDLTALGSASDNFGIDNVHFAQRVSSVPEPNGACVIFVGMLGLLGRRNRRS